MRLYNQQIGILLPLFIILLPHLVTAQISFQEVAAAKNVQHNIKKGSIGAGVSVYDFNKDGLDDLTLATEKGQLIGFYLNTGTAFEKIPALVNNIEEVKQILWADFDNDGDADLFVTSFWGQNFLYQNEGNLQLVDITQSSGLSLEKHATYGACWGDFNRDGWLDLLYNEHNYAGRPTGGNHLYQNNADGTFTEVTEIARMGNDNRVPFASAFLDYNNDQWPDIYTANDKLTANTLYENTRNGHFFDASRSTQCDVRMNAMCVNAADINQDGWVDIYVTNTHVGGQFFHNNGPTESILDITFENRAVEMGIAYEHGNGWGSTFFDADNDGDLDLYMCGNSNNPIVKGVHFYENIEKTHFEIITEGFEKDTFNSFSNAIADFDQDGMLDILVQNNDPAPFYLWENQTANDNHWVKIELEGVLSNRDAIGARIETYADELYQSNFTYCGFGFLGQNTHQQHVGLRQHSKIDSVIITWPSGHIDRLYDLTTNQLYPITEGATTSGQILVAADVSILPRPVITSLENMLFSNTLQIVPNPATKVLHIQTDFNLSKATILSLAGQVLKQYNLAGQASHTLSIDDLEQGLYLLKIQDNNGNFLVQKWVKM